MIINNNNMIQFKKIKKSNKIIDSYIYIPKDKEELLDLSKNSDLMFLKKNCKNLYKTLLKSLDAGLIIKLYDWDYDIIKNEYLNSLKLKKIINFIDYICYFEYEDDFINHNIYKNEYVDKVYDEKSIILMHNYNLYHISYIDIKYIYNLYIQLILALYSAYQEFKIYFTNVNNDFIFIIKNNYKKRYKYIINNTFIYLDKCLYKIIIADLSHIEYDNTNSINIDNYIYDFINNLGLFNKIINFTRKEFNNIKKKYI
jgi:hypothetical protein